MRLIFALLLLLSLPAGAITPPGTIIRLEATATYADQWGQMHEADPAVAELIVRPMVVCVRARDLYTRPLPFCPVRLAATCRARGSNYIDVWDGDYNPVTGYRRGIRVYLPAGDTGLSYTNGVMYVTTGACPQMGRILATSVEIQ